MFEVKQSVRTIQRNKYYNFCRCLLTLFRGICNCCTLFPKLWLNGYGKRKDRGIGSDNVNWDGLL